MLSKLVQRAIVAASLILLVVVVVAPPADAQIIETRESSANPMMEVFKSTVYGGLAGLLLGSATALAVQNDNGGEIIRWSFVGGTFLGFGYGMYHVSTRPQPTAALTHRPEGWALSMPTLQFARHADQDMSAVARLDRGVTVRTSLATVGF